jgi:pyruvate/2-oxoglutarate dehydrogenase complex dihydrolipoamide acyltransferase (E2) component
MKKRFPMIGALTAACAVAALSAYGALQAHASAAPSRAAELTHSTSKTQRGRLAASSALSPGVRELARNEGLDLSLLKQVAVARGQRPAMVFAASKGNLNLRIPDRRDGSGWRLHEARRQPRRTQNRDR